MEHYIMLHRYNVLLAERSAIMGPIWEGDGRFCIISLIISELLSDIPWIYHRMDILKIVMISMIFALFYGPEPKHISKKIFFLRYRNPHCCFAFRGFSRSKIPRSNLKIWHLSLHILEPQIEFLPTFPQG